MFFLEKKSDCRECGRCVEECVVNAIFLIKHKDGYRYPVENGQCIWCGKCRAVCPVSKKF